MPKSIQTHQEFIDEEHHQAVIAVRTNLTWYKVAFKSKDLENITLLSAGLEIKGDEIDFSLEELDLELMSFEAIAIIIVTIFEDK